MRYPSDNVDFINKCVDAIEMINSELLYREINILFHVINKTEGYDIDQDKINKLLNKGYLCVIAVKNDNGEYATEVAVTMKGLMAIKLQAVINRYN